MVSRRAMIVSGGALAATAGLGLALWPEMGPYRRIAEALRRLPEPGEGVAGIVRMAALAANGHNAQPWRFRREGGRLTIRADPARRTPVVDPDDHHLHVSLGCAAANAALAARALGHSGAVEIAGSGAALGIAIDLAPGPAAETPLYRSIPIRQSTRTAFVGREVPVGDLRLLEAAGREAGVALTLRTAPADREAILALVVAGNGAQMDDPAFVAELLDWIRFTPGEAIARRDGLFSGASGNPVVPGWAARRLFGAVFTKDAENDRYRDHVRSSAGIAVFTAARADPVHWAKVGLAFQRFALQAAALGIRTAHLNQPVEVPAVREELAVWLGAPGQRPDLVIRFGRGPVLPMSLRREVAEVLAPA